ncbi:uncharacterized protein FTOL_09106 [Fusarium torulosum]|uniref:Pal1-like protein n=1 Tax=Fusarium torulosum TaxID=33205 RepID=A0AAE8MDT1_9HYPO|nr:uncharacterized protein FTOL_09106 [Fusarium torulosum]
MSSATRAVAQAAGNAERAAATKLRNQELGKRTLYLKVSRAPVNFIERRSILRALEQHGPVEFFKLMPGQASLFVSVMKDSEGVAKAVSSSPINVNVPPSTTEPTSFVQMKGATAQFEHQESSKSESTEFVVDVTESPKYKHQGSSNSLLNRVWPKFVEKDHSFASTTLQHSLPDSIAAGGLRHWNVDFGKEATKDSKMVERLQLRDWIPSKIKESAKSPKKSDQSKAEEVTNDGQEVQSISDGSSH